MSPSDQPVEIRLTRSREEYVAFLQKLAHDKEFREEFEGSPGRVLADNGIEITPAEAIPTYAVAPDPKDIESALKGLGPPTLEWPWNGMWIAFPYVGLLAKPEEGGGPESA